MGADKRTPLPRSLLWTNSEYLGARNGDLHENPGQRTPAGEWHGRILWGLNAGEEALQLWLSSYHRFHHQQSHPRDRFGHHPCLFRSMEKVYQWILKQHAEGSRANVTDIVALPTRSGGLFNFR